ncbi:MAG TPA: hypothetical protein VHX66_06280 [Solirubrobacteraceae bacterium]|jgi:hypothetical protein|nr:hypothetical protein [Solirubrobacteraceae bacterium]
MLAHATRQDGLPSATDRPGEAPSATLALTFLRWLDLIVIIAAAPFVLISSLPSAGFAIGAGTWLAARLVVTHVERRAWNARDTRSRAALHLTAILGRVWFIALGVLVARFAIGTPDGIAAAVTVLVAFTIELMMKLMVRGPLIAPPPRRTA